MTQEICKVFEKFVDSHVKLKPTNNIDNNKLRDYI